MRVSKLRENPVMEQESQCAVRVWPWAPASICSIIGELNNCPWQPFRIVLLLSFRKKHGPDALRVSLHALRTLFSVSFSSFLSITLACDLIPMQRVTPRQLDVTISFRHANGLQSYSSTIQTYFDSLPKWCIFDWCYMTATRHFILSKISLSTAGIFIASRENVG